MPRAIFVSRVTIRGCWVVISRMSAPGIAFRGFPRHAREVSVGRTRRGAVRGTLLLLIVLVASLTLGALPRVAAAAAPAVTIGYPVAIYNDTAVFSGLTGRRRRRLVARHRARVSGLERQRFAADVDHDAADVGQLVHGAVTVAGGRHLHRARRAGRRLRATSATARRRRSRSRAPPVAAVAAAGHERARDLAGGAAARRRATRRRRSRAPPAPRAATPRPSPCGSTRVRASPARRCRR